MCPWQWRVGVPTCPRAAAEQTRPPAREAHGSLTFTSTGRRPWLQSKHRVPGSQEEVWAEHGAVSA